MVTIKNGKIYREEQSPNGNKKKKNQKGLFQKSSFLDDGFQAYDIAPIAITSAADAIVNGFEGLATRYEGVMDATQYLVSDVADFFGADDYAEQVRDKAKQNAVEKFISPAKAMTEDVSAFGNMGRSISNAVGNLGGMAMENILLPGSALKITGISAYGSGRSEAYQNNATDGQAFAYGVMNAGVEVISERIFAGLGKAVNLGKAFSSADDVVASKLGGAVRRATEKALKSPAVAKAIGNITEYGIKSSAEGVEEVVAGFGNAVAKKLTYESDEDLKKLAKDENLLEQFIISSIVSSIAQGGDVITSTKQGKDFVSGYTDTEQKVVDKAIEKRIAEKKKANGKVTAKDKSNVAESVKRDLERGYLTTDEINEALGGDSYTAYKSYADSQKRKESAISAKIEALEKKINTADGETDVSAIREELATARAKLDNLKETDKTAELKAKLDADVMKLAKGSKLNESYREITRRGENFSADLTKYTAKEQAIVQKAIDSGVLNNTNRTHDFVDFVARVSASKGIDFDFADNAKIKESGFAVDGAVVNGYVNENGITLNAESVKSLDSVVGHEITHVLQGTKLYDSLKSTITEYAKSKGIYDGRLKAIQTLYEGKNADVEAELTADLVGDLIFTDEAFINRLTSNRTLFDKIFGEIKYLARIATAGSREARQLEKAKVLFEKAYQQAENGTNVGKTKYYIVALDNGNLYVKANRKVIQGTTKAEQRKNITEFFNTLLNGEEALDIHTIEGDILTITKNETATKAKDEYKSVRGYALKMSPEEFSVKMRVASHIDEIVEVSSKKDNHVYPDNKNHKFAKDGFSYRRAFFEDFDGQYYEITLSIGHNGTVATVYNVGKIKESVSPSAKIIAVVGSKPSSNTLSKSNIPHPTQNVNTKMSLSSNISPLQSQYAKADSEYLSAVERGDMETAQRMVEEAAEKAGYDTDAYHGTNQGDFTVFDWDKTQRADGGFYGRGHYFTKFKGVAERYGERVVNAKLKLGKTFVWSDEVNSYKGKKPPELLSSNIVSRINMAKIFPDIFANRTMSYWEYDSHKGENVEKTIKWGEIEGIINSLSKGLFLREYADGTYRWHTEGRFWEVPVGESFSSKEKAEEGKFFAAINALKEKYDGLLSDMTFDDQTTYTQRYGTEITEALKKKGYHSAMDTQEGGEIVVFDSNQIKSADPVTYDDNGNVIPLSQRFDSGKDDIRYSLSPLNTTPEGKYTGKSIAYRPKATESVTVDEKTDTISVKNSDLDMDEVAKILNESKIPTETKRSLLTFIEENLLDKGMVFEHLSDKTGNRELEAKWQAIRNSERKAQEFINRGADGMKSLNTIRKEVEATGKVQEFADYMYHALNVDRMTLSERYGTENKPVFGEDVDADTSRYLVEQYEAQNPEFKQFAQEVYDYMNHLRSLMVDEGIITQETADLWAEKYPHYVPIHRADKNGNAVTVPLDTNRTAVNAPIKRATGGNQDINPLFVTMAERTSQTFKAIAKNSFGVELKNTLNSVVEEEAKTVTPLNPVTNAEGNDVDTILDNIDTGNGLLKEGKNGFNPTFTVFENGEKVEFEIDEDMYNALKPMSEKYAQLEATWLAKGVSYVNNVFRNLVTSWNPLFGVRNFIKDVQDVLLNSQHAGKTYKNIPSAFAQSFTHKGHYYDEYIAKGGGNQSYFNNKTKTFAKERSAFAKLVLESNGLGRTIDRLLRLNDAIEMTPRLAEYIASREAGRSIEVSMLDAARVTTNFQAGADLIKFLNRNGATFLNASVQGMVQNVRNVKNAHQKGIKGYAILLGKFALASVPVMVLNHFVWGDDEEYEELSDYIKDNYYIIGKINGTFIRIPKGRTLSVIQNAVEQVAKTATGNAKIDVDRFADLVLNNLAPNNPISDNLIAPIIQTANNKAWHGGDIVPTRLQDEPAAEQYDETTDAFSKWLGEQINVSPYKINYLIDQYSGVIGDIGLPFMTPQAESGAKTVVGKAIAPLTDAFTADAVFDNKHSGEFYDTKEELTSKANSINATDEDILKRKFIDSVSTDLSELYRQKREIENSDLSDSEKYKSVKEIQRQINSISEEALSEKDNVEIFGSYAEVSDRQYRLNEDGEWVKVDEKQKAKQDKVTEKLGISPSEYWEYKDMYDDAYDTPDKYAVSKAFDFDYATYKDYLKGINKIEGVKDENGNTINGSTKKNIIAHIESLPLSRMEKAILFKYTYPKDATYNKEIIQHLRERTDIPYADRVAILEGLGFKVKEGSVKW